VAFAGVLVCSALLVGLVWAGLPLLLVSPC
jgi:hypothetical protein